ncbi:MAG: glycosyltransferase family 2 protein [Synechococcaceae cyanobacterium]
MPGLAIIVATRNPGPLFLQESERLARQKAHWQWIVVDDHSTEPVAAHLPELANLQVSRNGRCFGAGVCRNLGMAAIARPYTLFLDDDDRMNWDMVETAMEKMDADTSIDVTMFAYDFLLNGEHRNATEHDATILRTILQGQPERLLSQAASLPLLAFTNYPWNKMYRSSFLRRAGIRFSETAVQNDILAHWQTILRANTLCLSERVLCTKVEYTSAERIGNTADHRCLEAFQALRETYAMLREHAPPSVAPIFLEFYLNLYGWLNSKAETEVRLQLKEQHSSLIATMEADGFLQGDACQRLLWRQHAVSLLSEPEPPAASILLAEISRLKRLAHALQAEKETIQHQAQLQEEELAHLRRTLRRKLVRLALFVGDGLTRLRSGN